MIFCKGAYSRVDNKFDGCYCRSSFRFDNENV